MEYIKGGLICQPDRNYDWMHYYASLGTSVEFDTFIRIFFTTRSKQDEHGYFKAYIGFVDCDKNDPSIVLRTGEQPVLQSGLAGTFDEHGTMVADVIEYDNKYYMYYMGWQRSGTVPYLIRLGLAISDDGEHFTKVSDGPVIGISRFLPFGIGNVSILIEDGEFHMWYTHYCPWIKTEQNGYRPNYDIRFAKSKNGLDWEFGQQCIVPDNENEALATPCVRKINGQYHMWYSFRPSVDTTTGKSGVYHLGYAVSDDGQKWSRADNEMTMPLSPSGWDAHMLCYPDVLQTEKDIFLFYSGNNYGQDGFGYAKMIF